MPLITRWQDFETHYPDGLTPAEELLVAACKAGVVCTLEDGTLPPEGEATPNREIRADLLRYLILGGCDACLVNGWGVRLYGGHITGDLDLSFASAKGITRLVYCRFEQEIIALQTRFDLLALSHSTLPRLNAQGAQVTGDVFLRGITAKATVTLSGATIGGQLSCTGAELLATESHALDAQNTQVTSAVFLRGITAKATVTLSGATIGGQLDCEGAEFAATKGYAFHGQRMCVTEGLFWRKVTVHSGGVNMSSAHVGDLVDDPDSWPPKGRLILDGFTYDRISAAFTDAHSRIVWLEQGTTWEGAFFPQPFTQLAKVLHEMGHEGDARKVLFHREKLLGQHARALTETRGLKRLWNLIRYPFRVLWDRALRYLAGYGYAPRRSFYSLVGLIFGATIFAHFAWEEGSFAPNSGPVLVSEGWQHYANGPGNPADLWSADGAPGQDWETFSSVAWAADLVIPIIDFGQSDAWAPSTTRGWWGKQLWYARWGFILAGWLVTALGAAAITGLIRRE